MSHIRFNVFFPCYGSDEFLLKTSKHLAAMSSMTFLSFTSLLITSFHVFLDRPMGKLLLTLKVLDLLEQALHFSR